MGEKTVDRSFAGGEISPDMYGRVDLAKFQTGLALCRNAFVLPHGPVENRPGTEYVASVKNPSAPVRLIPFTYNFTQTVVIEVGAGYFRFHSQAGTLQTGTPAAWSNQASTVTIPCTQSSATVTMTIASPAVITWTAHGLAADTPVIFSTTGALPTGITAGQVYYVLASSITANTFQVSSAVEGTAVVTTGTQSGVHTCTTANLSTAIVNWTSHGLAAGAKVQFTTTGALPSGIATGTPYYVVAPLANTFELALTAGGTPLQISAAATGTTTATYAYTPGDNVTLGGVAYACLASNANTTPPNSSYWYALPASGIYEIPNAYAQADLMNLHYVQANDVLTIVHTKYPVAELSRLGATNWAFSSPTFVVPTWCPTSCSAAATTPHNTTWNPFNAQYCVTTVQAGDLQESVASNITTPVSNDLTLLGNVNTVTWTIPAGVTPVRFNVYKFVNGLWGYIGQAAANATSFIDNNILANTSSTPPITDSGFNDAVGDYPGAVTYYQGRKWFAGSINRPQSVWATMSGTESNMSYTLPVQASNRLSFTINAREASGIQHMVPVANLMLLTPSTEWRVTSTDGNALWAGNLEVLPQSAVGSNNVNPITVGNSVLFSQSRGCRIREMSFSWQTQAYQSNDISVMASHLFDYKNVVDMAFSKAPFQFLHCVSSDGTLVSMTYVPEQQVAAWHHHDFNGIVESIAVITEQPAGTVSSEDMLYMVVNRVINGQTARYIERLHTRYFNTPSDAFFVDSGAANFLPGTYTLQVNTLTCVIPSHGQAPGNSQYFTFSNSALSGYYSVTSVIDTNTITLTSASTGQEVGTVAMTPAYQVTTVSGLTWLIGETVNILADGAPVPQQVVSNTGTITLPYPATKVIVGLPITAQIETLPASLNVDNGFGESLQKNVSQVFIRTYRTSGMYVGPDASDLTYATLRAATDLPGAAPALFSDVLQVMVQPSWNFDGSVFIQQTDPLPMTVCSVATDTAVR